MGNNAMAKVNGERPIYKIMIDKNRFYNDLCDDCEHICEGLNESRKFIEENAEKFIHNEIRVYQMNGSEFFASKWSIEETNEWYKKEYGIDEVDNPIEEICLCDLDAEVVWRETTDENDLEVIEQFDGVSSYYGPISSAGDLERIGSKVYKCLSLRQALIENGDFKEPYLLATAKDKVDDKNQEIWELRDEIKKLKEEKENLIIQLAEMKEEIEKLKQKA